MSESVMQNEERILLLQSYFSRSGLLLCNESKDLPGKFSIGGDWNSIITLMERGEVFYSKLYKNRASYLSRELYHQVKSFKQRVEKLSEKSKQVFEFIEAVDLASTQDVKNNLMISSKDFSACMNELHRELFVTVIKRERTLNDRNWCSYYWGTYHRWEQLKPLPEVKLDAKRIDVLLSTIMTEKQTQSLLK